MKKTSFRARNQQKYFALGFIILLGILAFYLSCKSKSPTESTSPLNGQVANQSTNNTTTSSSTTTSVNPSQSPTNTTTLITSRYLTTTTSSTSTSTTSVPTTTTSRGHIKLEWCSVTANGQELQNGGLVTVSDPDPLASVDVTIGISVKNVGNTPADNVVFKLAGIPPPPPGCQYISIIDGSQHVLLIEANGKCVNSNQAFLLRTESIGSCRKFKIQGEYGLPPFYFEVYR